METTRVKCLGITFQNDEERREYFLEKLREKLKDPEFRKIEGFPIGEDDDILALSDPPYYTACPNPWIGDFIKHYGKLYDPDTDDYRREPFAVDVSVGKTSPIYRAHSYHTKVPHLAIVPYILHYTEPGDVVLDGFCGSGMTAVAGQWCHSAPHQNKFDSEMEWNKSDHKRPTWGLRKTILCDLGPAATFIAANYTLPFDIDTFAQAGRQLLDELETELGWMYETLHTDGKTKGRIEYTVWSEVFSCAECSGDIVFVRDVYNPDTKRISKKIICPHCGATAKKKEDLDLLFETRFEASLGKMIKVPKRIPFLIKYRIGKAKYEKNQMIWT